MPNFQAHHPEEGVLLRFLDGELPGRKAKETGRHLEACWQCRSELEALRDTVSNCVAYRKNVLEAHFPEPPQAWPDLYREFARIDESLSHESIFARWPRLNLAIPRGAWAGMAAALAIFGLLFGLLRTPPVEAAVLLKKAVAAAASQPKTARRIRIQTRTGQFVRTVGARAASAESGNAAGAEASAVEARFEAAHYDYNDPLSARAYQAWSDGLAGKKDEVQTVADPGTPSEKRYQIRTVASSGDLAEATLTLRARDLRPVEERLEFRDREWIELTEIAEPATRSDSNAVASNVEVPVRPAEPPSRLAAIHPGLAASISDELQVLSALHQIGADLGDPVEVKLSNGKVQVGGVGIPRQTQQRIHDKLDAMANVTVQFSEPAAALPAVETGKAPSAAAPAGTPARVEQQIGSHAEFEKFGSQILEWNEAAMSRAYALRALAQRFPAEAEQALSAQDRQVLRDMAREHAAALTEKLTAIEHNLVPILTSLGASAPAHSVTGHTTWQAAAEDLSRTSRRVDVLLSATLGVTPAGSSPSNSPPALLAALAELRADLDDCHRLLQ
jgi:hypothetical protein